MKNLKSKNIFIAITILIIIVGSIIVATKGMTFGIEFLESKKIDIAIETEFNIADIKLIADEAIGGELLIEKVETIDNLVSITAKDITGEQKTKLIQKINEKYTLALIAEDLAVTDIPNLRGRDIINPIIITFVIITGVLLIYIYLRYMKQQPIKKILIMSISIITSTLLLASMLTIFRLPILNSILLVVITNYIFTIFFINNMFEERTIKSNLKYTSIAVLLGLIIVITSVILKETILIYTSIECIFAVIIALCVSFLINNKKLNKENM